MSVVYHQKSAPPWEHGGSQVEQYKSGLIRVMQSYIVPTATRETHVASFARGTELTGVSSPASDGLFIFPDPSCRDLNNGFSQIDVAAYGRKADKPDIELTYVRVQYQTTGIFYYLPRYKVTWAYKQGDSPTPGFLNTLKFRDPVYLELADGRSVEYTLYDSRTMDVNDSPGSSFGEFVEMTFNVEITLNFV